MSDTLTNIECISEELPPLRECLYCECPVPQEAGYEEMYCDRACFNAHLDTALETEAVEASMVEDVEPVKTLADLFDYSDEPSIVETLHALMPKRHDVMCSCLRC